VGEVGRGRTGSQKRRVPRCQSDETKSKMPGVKEKAMRKEALAISELEKVRIGRAFPSEDSKSHSLKRGNCAAD